jgi:hypothetical protein
MPKICADGTACIWLFIVKGSSLRYRVIALQTGDTTLEILADCLPRRAKVTTREDLAGVDSQNFTQWAADFALEVCDLTKNRR